MPLAAYFQKLPHFQHPDACYFLTYRLDGSMPKLKIQQLQDEYELKLKQLQSQKMAAKELYLQKQQLQFDYFKAGDAYLDKKLNEPYWLKEEEVAQIVYNSLLYLAQSKIKLWCFCIMPNHVHAVLNLLNKEDDLFKLMQQHKSFTGVQANKVLGRNGPFWEKETYDHIIRPGQFESIVGYTLYNPVMAGFVEKWYQWKWAYIYPEMAGAFKHT